jgi:AcrR family transcriptional regulator
MGEETKSKILEAAKDLFQQFGFNGVTMRDIADKADVNKGLLHYYYKTKQAIFLGVFKSVISIVFINISGILNRNDLDFNGKIDLIVDAYFDVFRKNPKLPLFVLSELSKLPELDRKTELQTKFPQLIMLFETALSAEPEIKQRDGIQFFMSLISLCAFPFVASPLFEQIVSDRSTYYTEFLDVRKAEIKKTLQKSLL